MPVFAAVTIMVGITLAWTLGMFALSDPWILAALVIVAVLTVQIRVFIPNDIRIYRQIPSDSLDTNVILRFGLRNARLSSVQDALQLAIIFVMATLRF